MEFTDQTFVSNNSLPVLPDRPTSNIQRTLADVKSQSEADLDEDEVSQQMTQSYSEISFKSDVSPDNEIPLSSTVESLQIADEIRRPISLSYNNLMPLTLEGSVHIEGNMTHFVAEEIEQKIRLCSPVSKKDTPGSSRMCTPSSLYRQLLVPQVGHLDSALINDLEIEAQKMATSVDSLIENLCGILHSISSITADNVDVYKNAVSKMSDAMDGNIKSMYTMMAKAEEVTHSMKIVEKLSVRIKEIKRLVDLFESFV
ncbi:BLOC-1-related complex subunit 6 [Diorhabda carinulata]|uniref:BLOC-1-related complex subunit 6 n=1 Tax=Diorhabda sublineata TaxID=1163346 RepID=UPI0024E0D5C9|nr:BLOC-1-related complex subunit 6 [Diorhabda sublineata]XP_057651502.1 BLOC-1-related complex subunit 6 [Diorhabda carinulata]